MALDLGGFLRSKLQGFEQAVSHEAQQLPTQIGNAVHGFQQTAVNLAPHVPPIQVPTMQQVQQTIKPVFTTLRAAPLNDLLPNGIGKALPKYTVGNGIDQIANNWKTQLAQQQESNNLFTKEARGVPLTPQEQTRSKILQQQDFQKTFNAVSSIGGGENDLRKAAFYLRSKLDPEAANILKNFAADFETHGMKGVNPEDLKTTGAILNDAFGVKSLDWSPKKMKNVVDLVLGKIGNMKNRAGIGLSVGELSHDEPVAQPLPVRPNNKVSTFELVWNRARNIIAKQGPAGQALAQDLQRARDLSETGAGRWVSQLPTVRKLSPKAFENFVDVAEGKAQPLSPLVAKAAEEWNTVRQQVHQSATNAGLDIGHVENYFPHTYDPSLFSNTNKFNQAVNHLVQSGQAETPEEAMLILSHAKDAVRNRRAGNLELPREINLPGYEKTKDALFGYLENAAHRVGQAATFGAKDEKALEKITQIAREGGDAQTAKDLYDISVGARKYDPRAQQLSGVLRRLNSASKLGLGAITNAGQSLNTMTVTGLMRTMKNLLKALSPEGKDFALKAGVILDGVLQDLREGGGFSGKVIGKLTAPGFNSVEKFNRTLAAWAGKSYAEDLARKAFGGSQDALRALKQMGVDTEHVMANGGLLSEQDAINAARKIVERTQFKVDPQDMPGWTSSPFGKLVSQFRSFSYNQSAFMKREVLDPALKGDVRPLLRWLVLAPAVGGAVTETKNILRNRKSEENPAKRVNQYYSAAGTYGLGGDVLTGLFPMNGRYLDPNRATTLAIGTLGGPTFGSMAEGYGALTNAIQGKPQNLERFAMRQVPLVGSTLQNTLLPYQSAQGDVNRRFGGVPQASAQTLPTATAPGGTLSATDKAHLKQQVTQINAQEKQILGNNGVNLPFVGQLGGISDDQKNQQVAQLEAQKKALQDQISGKVDYLKVNPTGNAIVDRELYKKQAGAITTQMNAIMKQVAQGQLDPQTAAIQLDELAKMQKSLRQKTSTGRLKHVRVPHVSARRAPAVKTGRVPRLKVKKVKIKVAKPKRKSL